MIETSTFLIVTGSWLMPSTQAVSHGAGHSRPVNSGKLLVACSRSIAPSQSSRQTRSFHSGMMLPSGQPWWQNGMPQSMQRPACSVMIGSSARPAPLGVDLVPVVDPLLDRSAGGDLAAVLEEALGVSHDRPLPAGARCDQPWSTSIILAAVSSSSRPSSGLLAGLEHQLVVAGHHLGEARQRRRPVGQQRLGDRRNRSPRRAAGRCRAAPRRLRPRPGAARPARWLTRHSSRSSTNATPPDMPAAKLRPVGPRTTTRPPVMYSQPWSPTPSTTAVAPELRTQNRSPTRRAGTSRPTVAP